MNTQDLIAELASRATPVTPLRRPAVRFGAWAAVAIGCALLGVVIFKTRPHLSAVIGQSTFFLTTVFAAALAAWAGFGALVLAIPGAERTARLRWNASGLVVLWASLLIVNIVAAGHGFQRIADWPICFARVIGMGLIPGFVLFRMLRVAAPLRPRWAAAMAAAASMAVAGGAIQFICPLSDPAHALFGHFGPVVVIGAIAAVSARRVLD